MNRYPSWLWTLGTSTLMLAIGCAIDNHLAASSDLPKIASTATNTKSIVNYQPTTAEFPNPERGFYGNIDLMGSRDLSEMSPPGRNIMITIRMTP